MDVYCIRLDDTVSVFLLIILVFNVDPDLTREGCSIPVTLTLEEETGRNVLLLPLGCCDDGAHSQNEKINRSNFINGVSTNT